jgi:Ca2+-binding EF-hand superfamily protein
MVVEVEAEARKLVNGLPKQQKMQVDFPHILECMESSTKQYVKPASAISFCF